MSDSEQSGAGRREVAYRVFAAEYEDADFEHSASDEERAPNYVITPTGARANRVFVVGVLTEIEPVNEEMLRARVVDPTGAFVVYAGQYQPDEMAALERLDPPTFVAITGKARTFQPRDADTIYTSIRPETVSEVDTETRDRWTVGAAERTLDRISWMAAALDTDLRGESLQERLTERGVDEGLAEGIALALEHYGTTGEYLQALREMALDATRLVAGDAEEVEPVTIQPGDGTTANLSALTDRDLSGGPAGSSPESPTDAGTEPETPPEAETADGLSETEEPSETEPAPTSEDRPDETGPTTDEVLPNEKASANADDTVDPDEFDPEEFELDEEEREEIEAEYGTDFQTGTEVSEPGEADIETPDEAVPDEQPGGEEEPRPADESHTESEDVSEPEDGNESESVAEPEDKSESDDESPQAPKEGVDLEDAAVEAMEELDDGTGAAREAVIETLVDRQGADPAEVEDAIQDALMDGRCYEPDDDTLKSI